MNRGYERFEVVLEFGANKDVALRHFRLTLELYQVTTGQGSLLLMTRHVMWMVRHGVMLTVGHVMMT